MILPMVVTMMDMPISDYGLPQHEAQSGAEPLVSGEFPFVLGELLELVLWSKEPSVSEADDHH